MNWRLVLLLSLFGLAMGVATVFVIPSNIEPLFWLAIFIVCAVIIAKRGVSKPFVHGLCVSLVNSVWITGAHVLFYDRYIAGHAQEAQATANFPVPGRGAMLLIGPAVGIVSGLILGLFAFIASKLLKPTGPAQPSPGA